MITSSLALWRRGGPQPRLKLVDPGEQLAGEHRARVVEAQVAPQPRAPASSSGGVLAAEQRRRARAAAGLDQAEPDEPADQVRVKARLRGEDVDR